MVLLLKLWVMKQTCVSLACVLLCYYFALYIIFSFYVCIQHPFQEDPVCDSDPEERRGFNSGAGTKPEELPIS